MNTFQITSSLEEVYPDIEGELCSKHTVLLNQINKAYKNSFAMHPPAHYVVSKLMIDLIKTQKTVISMGLQQGTVIILSEGEQGGQVHISGNFLKEDIVLEGSGKSLNSQVQNDLILAIQSIIECATEDLSLNRINGGFIYCNIFDSVSNQSVRNSLLIGLFMSIVTLNNLLDQYSHEQLIAKLKSNVYLNSCNIDNYFACCDNRELLVRGSQISKIKLQSKYKFVFLSLSFIEQAFNFNNENEDYESLVYGIDLNSLNILNLFSKIEQMQKSGLKDVVSKMKEDLKIKTFIFCGKYAIFLVQSYRYAELIGKISKIVHKIQQSKMQNQDEGGLQQRFGSPSKIREILFSSVPSKPLSILDPSSSLWFN